MRKLSPKSQNKTGNNANKTWKDLLRIRRKSLTQGEQFAPDKISFIRFIQCFVRRSDLSKAHSIPVEWLWLRACKRREQRTRRTLAAKSGYSRVAPIKQNEIVNTQTLVFHVCISPSYPKIISPVLFSKTGRSMIWKAIAWTGSVSGTRRNGGVCGTIFGTRAPLLLVPTSWRFLGGGGVIQTSTIPPHPLSLWIDMPPLPSPKFTKFFPLQKLPPTPPPRSRRYQYYFPRWNENIE